MTEQKLLAALAVATVGLMLVGGVAAKPRHCRKDCKQDITDCLAVVPKNKDCSGTTAEKTACRKMHAAQRKTCRRLVKLCRQQNPSMSGTCLLSSTTTSTLTTVTSTTMPPPLACGTFLLAWGGWYGPGNGQFTHPDGVATDGSGNVYVADSYPNNRIQKFDANGTFLTTWGSSGSGNGQFSDPEGVATDGSGHVYVTDLGNSRVQIFDASGSFLTMWGSAGSANGQFSHPDGVATDGTGNVYVADTNNHRIQKFDASGAFVTTWGTSGSGNGEFSIPVSVATDGSGNVYVGDGYSNNRIQKFDANGTFLTTWGSFGSGNGQLNDPYGVATDSSGNVYVADTGNNRIQKFDASGTFLTTWGTFGADNGQFQYPYGVATDGTGNVYVADFDNNRIQKFACPSATTSTSTTTTMSGATTSTTGSTPMPTSTTSTSGPTSTSTASSTTSTSLHFADNGDGTVTDNQTGLIWEKKVDGHNCLHCVYDSYTWSASGPTSDGTVFTAFLTDLNGGATGTGNCVSSDGSTQIGGFNNQCDWRLPTIGEFQTIVDVSAPGCALGSPCIAPIFGPTVASYYFSASVDDTAHPNGVWGAEFFDGTEVGLNSDARIFVRAVRGPRAPSTTPRFIDNGDGTVTDHQTGLQWEQKVAGSSCLHCVNDTYAWTSSGTAPDAFRNFLNYLNGGATGVGNCTSGDGNSQIGGFENHCDWRLPTIAELRTTLDTSQGNCGGGSGACIDPTFGPTAASLYWSSTTFAGAPSVAWFVGFSNGEVFNDGKGKNLSVRAVRGGS